ncbi:hypothetical protein [Sphingomonas mollis]|uniref:Uncharacterized protein n=1 Tax=Sphingomonas mollis TaxID=2795726 RepID=A0ABS0XU12_9SPHN|nr:hypothetical protein [Sphingomonas sp. BT553]MBJ6123255.1 hypothetical protein [Sphingomonas sp. BT553]
MIYYRLNPRVRLFIEQVVWVGGAYLAVTGLLAIVQGRATGPDWWIIPIFLVAAAVGACIREIPYNIRATDLSSADK